MLAFSRALVIEQGLLLVDEPSTGLAPSIVEDVFRNVQTVNELGTSILMVEQNARGGSVISDRDDVFDRGTVAYEGKAGELLDDPEVSQLCRGRRQRVRKGELGQSSSYAKTSS
ncbi:branched-chain amino acid transport system ATP-binding protein [Halogranum amylolyticum]|uniref:Branched-chain amino acid transport system ATP-binding protein n=1 Tax=Halogranum amylolyticum TaxID=660520 RepID=A0A1H8SI78_9EURY|nr:branched-chain amino acid transport system ATP-binding protein [Halogranum amylolyticum]